jgi:hypothetical protein
VQVPPLHCKPAQHSPGSEQAWPLPRHPAQLPPPEDELLELLEDEELDELLEEELLLEDDELLEDELLEADGSHRQKIPGTPAAQEP